jgi:hypothetical protein
MQSFVRGRDKAAPYVDTAGMRRRDLLALTALGLVAGGPGSAIAVGPCGQLTWGVHVSLAPVWFDPLAMVVMDQDGRPLCCELWPGNTADVTTLLPVVDRLGARFSVGRICVVADRGMISAQSSSPTAVSAAISRPSRPSTSPSTRDAARRRRAL